MFHVKNSQTFEERGHAMLAALETAETVIFERLADKTRALRSNYFAALNEIAAKARELDQRQMDADEE